MLLHLDLKRPVKHITLSRLIKTHFTLPQPPAVHCGHVSSSQRAVTSGFVLVSQLKSSSLHSTSRLLNPEPQVTEHYISEKRKKLSLALIVCSYIQKMV